MADQTTSLYHEDTPASLPRLPLHSRLVRRPFSELHPKDQQTKQGKKLCIEANWRCDIQDCLPPAIRPRCEVKKGSKARVGDVGVAEEVWWNWSVELLKILEELSALTLGQLDFAQQLLALEVEQRQRNPKSVQRKILELVLGDGQRVVDDLRKSGHTSMEHNEQQDYMTADEMGYGGHATHAPEYVMGEAMEDEGHMSQAAYYAGMSDEIASSPMDIKREHNYTSQGFRAPAGLIAPIAPMIGSNARGPNDGHNTMLATVSQLPLEIQLQATELKAKAARLRAKASRCEVEAAQLEADQLEVQAEILRVQMESVD